MIKSTLLFSLSLLIFSCSNTNENSKIEVIKYDNDFIEKLQSNYDSTYTESPRSVDFWEIDIYIKDSTKSSIMKDSLGNIVAITQFTNGKRVFVEEYFSNGQLKVKNDFPTGKIDGPVTAYYPNGQIESTGQWEDYKRVGIWRYYDSAGKLEIIEHFDENGKLNLKEKIKN
jgi:antitoxin component YwqK of YwqJK toxin-antitoxin module